MVTSYQGLLAALACDNVKCKIRSFLLSRSTRSFLKVDLRNGTPSGVSVTGASNDASLTTGKAAVVPCRILHCSVLCIEFFGVVYTVLSTVKQSRNGT